MDTGVEHRAKRFNDDGAHAAEAFGEGVGAEEHHGASFRDGERSADSTGVGADKIDLQLADLFGRDAHGGEFAEAGVDAVGGFVGGDQAVNDGAGGPHAGDGGGSEGDGLVMQCHGVELIEGEVVAGEKNGHGDSLKLNVES